jgi:hypothetical protein
VVISSNPPTPTIAEKVATSAIQLTSAVPEKAAGSLIQLTNSTTFATAPPPASDSSSLVSKAMPRIAELSYKMCNGKLISDCVFGNDENYFLCRVCKMFSNEGTLSTLVYQGDAGIIFHSVH